MNFLVVFIVCIGGFNIDCKLCLLVCVLFGLFNFCELYEMFGGVVCNVVENLVWLGLFVVLIVVVGDDVGGCLLFE